MLDKCGGAGDVIFGSKEVDSANVEYEIELNVGTELFDKCVFVVDKLAVVVF